jgi:ActR/RegA family two-component response regulator
MTKQKLTSKNILLVEDDFILALDAEDTIAADGANVSLATNVKTALEVLKQSEIHYAIVDFHLGSDTSKPIIKELMANEIPFAVVTGAELNEIEDLKKDSITVFRKPVDYKWVVKKLSLIRD